MDHLGDFERIDFLRLAAACLDQADLRTSRVPQRVHDAVSQLIADEESDDQRNAH